MNGAFLVCLVACILLGCMIKPARNHDARLAMVIQDPPDRTGMEWADKHDERL